MGWIKEHRFALTLGLTCTIAAIVGLIIFRFPGTWAFHPQETTSLSAVDFQKFQYALSSCPSEQSFRVDFDGSGRPLDISVHTCDKEAKDAPQWLKGSSFLAHPEFVIAVRKGWFSKKIVGGEYSEVGYSESKPVRFQNKDAVFLVTTPQGSGAFVEWCLFGEAGPRLACIPMPDESILDDEALRHLPPGYTVGRFYPDYNENQLVFTADFCKSGVVAHCSQASLGTVGVVCKPSSQGFHIAEVRRQDNPGDETAASKTKATDEALGYLGGSGTVNCEKAFQILREAAPYDSEAKLMLAFNLATPTAECRAYADYTDCSEGMRIFEKASSNDEKALRFYAMQMVDGNSCTKKDYITAYQALASVKGGDSVENRRMLRMLWTMMNASEREFIAGHMSTRPVYDDHHDFTLPFLGALSAEPTLTTIIKEKGDNPAGEPVWLSTFNGDMILFIVANCSERSERSDSLHCVRIYGGYFPYHNLLNASLLAQPFGPFFGVENLSSPAIGKLSFGARLDSPSAPPMYVEYVWNGHSFDLSAAYKNASPGSLHFPQPIPAETHARDDRIAEMLKLKASSRGYRVIGNLLQIPLGDNDGGVLSIQKTQCISTEHCEMLFIAIADHFIGTDTAAPSWGIKSIVGLGGGGFRVNYSTGVIDLGSVSVSYRWDGKQLVATGTAPTRPQAQSR